MATDKETGKPLVKVELPGPLPQVLTYMRMGNHFDLWGREVMWQN